MPDTAPASLPTWLQDFCSTSEDRPALQRPFTFETPMGVVTCASNGRRMIVLDTASDYPAADEKMRPGLRRVLEAPAVGVPISLAALRAFLTKHVPEVSSCTACRGTGGSTCSVCSGTGREPCQCDCGDQHTTACEGCDGSGESPCEICKTGRHQRIPVRIGHNLYDARYFARPTEVLAGDTATFVQVSERDTAMARLIGDGWQLAVMGLRDDGEIKPVAEVRLDELVEGANV